MKQYEIDRRIKRARERTRNSDNDNNDAKDIKHVKRTGKRKMPKTKVSLKRKGGRNRD